MYSILRSTAAAALLASFAAGPVFADAPKLPMSTGEATVPSALAQGEQYLSMSKRLDCENSTCTATFKGRAKKQTLIDQISCVTVTAEGAVIYAYATEGPESNVALAILPVASRTLSGTTEYAVVGDTTQIVLGPDDKVFLGIAATAVMQQAVCTLTGTTTKL